MNKAIELFIDELNIDRNRLDESDLISSLMNLLHIKSSKEKFISFIDDTYGDTELKPHYKKINISSGPVSLISKINNLSEIGRVWFNLSRIQFLKIISCCLKDNYFEKNTLIIEATLSKDLQRINKMIIIDHCHLEASFGAFYSREIDEFMQVNYDDVHRNLNSVKFACQKGGEIWLV